MILGKTSPVSFLLFLFFSPFLVSSFFFSFLHISFKKTGDEF